MTSFSPIQSSRGFGLLEVLVTVLILSIGLLGLASMQLKSMQQSSDSYHRSQATLLAYDITERIRANIDQIAAYQDADTSNIQLGENATTACKTAACSTSNLADFDLANWKTDVESLLPSGKALISNDGLQYTITIMWDENRAGGTACDSTPALQCLAIVTQFKFE